MADAPPTRSGAPLWVRITLIVSLALNLLIIGAIVGALLGRGKPGDDPRAARDLAAAPFVMALERGERRELLARMREQSEPMRENRAMLRARFEALLTALRDEIFDRDRIEELLSGQREVATARQQIGEVVLLDHLEMLSLEDRRAYASRLDGSLRRGRDRH